MLLSAVSVLVVAQSSSEIPEGLMNNPVHATDAIDQAVVPNFTDRQAPVKFSEVLCHDMPDTP